MHDHFARAVEVIALIACSQLEKWLGLGQMHAAGLAQHYGLPSEFLDVTSSLAVAAAFAVGELSSRTTPRKVSFAVIDMRRAIGRCILADLASMIKVARRPAVQHAYGLCHRSHTDLKDSDCIADVGVRWHEILVYPEEAGRHAATPDLLDAHKDRAAGVLQLILDDLAKGHQKWPDELAEFLSSTVAAAPFVTRVIRWEGSNPAEVELASAEEMRHPFNEVATRKESRQLWSRAFPNVTNRRLR